MKITLRTTACLLIVAAVGIGCAQAGSPVFVTGSHRGQIDKDKRGVQAADAVRKAFAQLQSRLGTAKVKAYIVSDNLIAPNTVTKTMNALAGQTPWAGQANNWPEYLPVDRDSLSKTNETKNGINITAICGDVDVQFAVVTGVKADKPSYDLPKDEWKKRWLAQKPAHVAKGKALAEKINIVADKTNVVLVMGTMHTPRNKYIYEGVAAGLDKSVYLAGGSGADFAAMYANGKNVSNAILAVRISGDFVVATTQEHGSEDIPAKMPKILARLKKQIPTASPTAMVYFGCGGWRESPAEQQKELEKFLPDQVGIFGQFCGGEFGRFPGSEGFAGTDYAVMLVMAEKPEKK